MVKNLGNTKDGITIMSKITINAWLLCYPDFEPIPKGAMPKARLSLRVPGNTQQLPERPNGDALCSARCVWKWGILMGLTIK